MSFSSISQPVKIFFSYASNERRDKNLFNALLRHLGPLKQQGYFEEWYDNMISGGSDWRQMIDTYIHNADIIVFLISAEFLNPEYYHEVEIKQAIERYEEGNVRILSILLRPIDWIGLPLDKCIFLPPNGKPISTWSNKDNALAEVAKGIRKIVVEIRNHIGSREYSSHSKLPLRNVPGRRNSLFTGREEILATIHNHFTSHQTSRTHILALNGLGGIGKTQIAVEYTYRYQSEYQTIFWINATSHTLFSEDIHSLADRLSLPKEGLRDDEHLFAAIKHWLQNNKNWLLLLDNLEDLNLVDLIVPSPCNGYVLLTTRQQATGALAHAITIAPMPLPESTVFLLRRAKIITEQAEADQASTEEYQQAQAIAQIIAGLPLALDQAGAYIEETQTSLTAYLILYHQRRNKLLGMRGQFPNGHPEPVTTTLSLAFEKVEQLHSAGMELLHLFAFLHPDAIPDEMLVQGASVLPLALQELAADSMAFDDVISTFLHFSLIHRRADRTTSSIHRIVQAVLRDSLPLEKQRRWAISVVLMVNHTFPDVNINNWPLCQRYAPQAQICAQLISDFHITLNEAAELLYHLGTYCYERAQNHEAETYLTTTLQLREQNLGPLHIDTANSLNALGMLYRQQGLYQQAGVFLQRSLAIHNQTLGPEHPETAKILNNLGLLYYDLGKYTSAEPLYLQALMIYEHAEEPDPYETATTLDNLGVLYHTIGKLTQVEPLYKRALALRSALLPSGHPDLTHIFNNLAELYQDLGDYQQAEPLLVQVLSIHEQTAGPEHPDSEAV